MFSPASLLQSHRQVTSCICGRLLQESCILRAPLKQMAGSKGLKHENLFPESFLFFPTFLCLLLFLRKCDKLKNNKAPTSLSSSNLVLHMMPEVSQKKNVIYNVILWKQIRETYNLSVTSAYKVTLQILYLLHINTLHFQILPPQTLGNL